MSWFAICFMWVYSQRHPISLCAGWARCYSGLLVVFSGEKFQVLDSCTRAMLRTEDQEDQGQLLANVFNLKLLENQEDRQVSYMLKTNSM